MEVLFQFLLSIWQALIPFIYLAPDQRGVQWRSFPFIRFLHPVWPKHIPKDGCWWWEIGPGIHWKWPLIDDWVAEVVKVRYVNIDNISGETKDRIPVMISLSVKFAIGNIKVALIETEDFVNSLVTDAQNIVVEWLEEQDYAELSVRRLIEECYPRIQKVAPEWGCRMRAIGVNSKAKHRLYRFLTE